jgi:K+-transporting ATPase c subunit
MWCISFRLFFLLTLITGIIYPAIVSALAHMMFPAQADGSLILGSKNGVLGSKLIAYPHFKYAYFYPRISLCENLHTDISINLDPPSASCLDPLISIDSFYTQQERIMKASNMDLNQIQNLKQKTYVKQYFSRDAINVSELNVLLYNFSL